MKAFLAGLLALFAGMSLLHGTMVEVPDQQARVDVPGDWTTGSTANGWMAKNVAKGEVIVIQSFENKRDSSYDSTQIDEFKKGFVHGAEKDGVTTQLGAATIATQAGAPGFAFDCQNTYPNGKVLYGRLHAITANQKIYQIIAIATSQDSLPETDGIATSFQFDSPPQLPAHDSAAYKFGYRMGQVAFYAMALAVVLIIFRSLFRKRS